VETVNLGRYVLQWRRAASNNLSIVNETVFDLPAIKELSSISSLSPEMLYGCSVVDLGCLSRILIFIHPGSPIPDPGFNNRNRMRRGKLVSDHFL
jgi:hypothetical protein